MAIYTYMHITTTDQRVEMVHVSPGLYCRTLISG